MDTDTITKAFSAFLSSQTEKIEKKEMLKVVNIVYADIKKKSKKDVNDEKPKRQPTAYNLFMREQMNVLKQNEEGKEKEECMTAKEKMQHIAKLWASKKEHLNSDDETVVVKETTTKKKKTTVK